MRYTWLLGCLLLASPVLAQRGSPILVPLSPLDTIISTAADTTVIDVESGYGSICGPMTLYFFSKKLSDSISLKAYYDINAGPSDSTGWWTIDSTIISEDISGAGEIKQTFDTLLATHNGWLQMRCRVIGQAGNDKGPGAEILINAVAQRCLR